MEILENWYLEDICKRRLSGWWHYVIPVFQIISLFFLVFSRMCFSSPGRGFLAKHCVEILLSVSKETRPQGIQISIWFDNQWRVRERWPMIDKLAWQSISSKNFHYLWRSHRLKCPVCRNLWKNTTDTSSYYDFYAILWLNCHWHDCKYIRKVATDKIPWFLEASTVCFVKALLKGLFSCGDPCIVHIANISIWSKGEFFWSAFSFV